MTPDTSLGIGFPQGMWSGVLRVRESGNMYMIAGLGNPGRQYEHTRHNAGFEVIDRLAAQMGVAVEERKHRALCGKGILEGQKVILIKPQTFMNLSGESIRGAVDFYKIPPDRLIVVYDDISLPPGQLRIRRKGSAGGHNGIKNIIAQLNTQEFPRVKIGVGAKPDRMDLADYVLSHFSAGEWEMMEGAFEEAAKAVRSMIAEGTDAAMNQFNGKNPNKDIADEV